MNLLGVAAITLAGITAWSATADASAATLSRSVEVNAPAGRVWAKIGPYCSIKDWHPALGACTEDGKTPPTRTLVTKDGKATFVERRTANDAAKHSYSYTFVSSPIPVSHYLGTLKVTPKGNGRAVITWSSVYQVEPDKAKAASEALLGVYDSGLEALKAQFGG